MEFTGRQSAQLLAGPLQAFVRNRGQATIPAILLSIPGIVLLTATTTIAATCMLNRKSWSVPYVPSA